MSTARDDPAGDEGTGESPSGEGRLARCRCGYTRDHVMVSPVPTYTGWAKFWVFFMGVSYKPVALDFQCRVCKEVFDRTEDPDTLASYL